MEKKFIPSLIKEILKYKKTGKVFDLGAGFGRNSILLAKRGFEVTAIDKSKEKLAELRKKVKEGNLNMKLLNEKIENIDWKEKYDMVLCNNVLHFLKEADAKRTIQRIKDNTKKRGINLITVFNVNNPNKNFPYLFEKEELRGFYSDWEILRYREFISELETHGGKLKPHRHGISELIAKKP